VEATKQKEEKREKTLSPRSRKACHRVSTALLKSVAEIGTLSKQSYASVADNQDTGSSCLGKMKSAQ
jgi:hypothetical protein